jgi:hypothetical protein
MEGKLMKDQDIEIIEESGLSSLVKKAKRKTILRNVLTALGVSLLVLTGSVLANSLLLNLSERNASRDISLFKQISGPNEYVAGYGSNSGLLFGTIDYETYKIIEGVPLVWKKKTYDYNILGSFSRSSNRTPINVEDPTMQINVARSYNSQNGQREMLFYLPEADYGKYLNDLPSLNEVGKDKFVEIGISFDKVYSVEEIQAMLPIGVHPVWYWVETEHYNPRKNMNAPLWPQLAYSIYGFGNTPNAEKTFISNVVRGLEDKGKYYNEYKRIFDYLRKDKPQPVTTDVKINGVVVTGTVESLQTLNGKVYVKAASLGAIVSKY